jgi:uncharacterized protein YceK
MIRGPLSAGWMIMRRTVMAAVVLLALSVLGGCGTAVSFTASGGVPTPYSGTLMDAAAIYGGAKAMAGAIEPPQKFDRQTCIALGCGGLLDAPFSIVADTLVLPATATVAVKKRMEPPHTNAPSDEVSAH